ncbi:D-glycerate dehydrogenase [Ornithinimicrobium sp. CNJ-824]|uniref:2-hydroxyacid dehydrogenase n=1 Tax=Ornithinimicrobium sp. CNJ-824 TaxID=1904966 RepID=UPI000962D82F|nr:D-glycerate dehydrogenase [Ornithinimicrobium sp. CNJ-824]OLT23827.1 D-glycerate dehydrogenase [Ornithinimicrobium sp. CNJ-824]
MATVVVTGRLPEEAFAALRGAGHEVRAWEREERVPREQLLGLVAGADALVTLVTEKVDPELLDAAGTGLRVVANVAVGYDNVDVAACAGRGVVVTNTPGVLEEATADLAMALVLMTTRRLGEAERLVRSGRPWQWGMGFMLGRGLQGRTLGIVGLGGIGRATARRARAFGMQVLYTGRRDAPAEVVEELSTRRVELPEMLETADVVSLHLPYSRETHHLVGADELARLGPTSYLVNTARGPVVDEEALVAALRGGTIAGAGLDVYEHEPRVHPGLLELENVVLLPHLGSATVETRTQMALLAARNVVAVLGGQEPLTPVG